jgi:sugar phosphate isomerase/epimerase
MKNINHNTVLFIALIIILVFIPTLKIDSQTFQKEALREKKESFKVTMVGANFLLFNTDSTIKMTQQLDIHYLCVKNKHLPMNSTDEQIAVYKAKLSNAGITPVSVGLFYLNKKEEVDDAFEYAKRLGVKLIIGTPKHEMLSYVEQKVKEYDIKLAIHIHGNDISLYPNAKDVIDRIKNMDPRMGLCLDIGHDIRTGANPIEDLKMYKDRIFDIHIKNVTAADKTGFTCEMDKGVIDIPAFVKMMRNVKYAGTCSLEFEKDKQNPYAGIAESIGYLRGVIDANK